MAAVWDHYVDGNPQRLPWNIKMGQCGWNLQVTHQCYSVLPSSVLSLSVKQLIPPELCVWNIPFLQRQCVCVFCKVSWFWVTWSWSAQNLLETSSWLLCRVKQSIFRAPRVQVTCHNIDLAHKVKCWTCSNYFILCFKEFDQTFTLKVKHLESLDF